MEESSKRVKRRRVPSQSTFGTGHFAGHAELSLQSDYRDEHYKDKNNKEYPRKCLFYCRVLRGNSMQGHSQERQLKNGRMGFFTTASTTAFGPLIGL